MTTPSKSAWTYLLVTAIILIFYCIFYQSKHTFTDIIKVDEPNNINEARFKYYLTQYADFNNSNSWFRYRLADMVRNVRMKNSPEWGYEYHKKNFPNSIATEYMFIEGLHAPGINYPLLQKIVKKRIKNKTELINSALFNSTLIIHLRTGDVIERYSNLTVNELLSQKHKKYYTQGLLYYKLVLKQVSKHNLHHALFVSGYHQGKHHNKSMIYIMSIMKFFEDNGYEISLRLNENPDDDFMLMCNSKYFVRGGGGFSKIITNMVKLNGGTVYPCITLQCLDPSNILYINII